MGAERFLGTGVEAGFSCAHCGAPVPAEASGTRHRNHCPLCLWSMHVDIRPGDRASLCRGKMEPISLWVKGTGETMILHRCTICGSIKPNRCAGDDSEAALREIAERLRRCV
ncbi:MAG: RNHCP domain-containing protein [Spirochaetia bacterium]